MNVSIKCQILQDLLYIFDGDNLLQRVEYQKTFCKTSDIPQGHRAFQVKRWPPSVQKNIYIFYILYWKTFWWCEKKSERKFKNNYFMWLYFCFIVFEIHQRKYYLVFKGSFSVSFIGLYTYIFHDDNFTKSHIQGPAIPRNVHLILVKIYSVMWQSFSAAKYIFFNIIKV